MNSDVLHGAKARLRIPELWRLLCLPGEPGKSCRCPWRNDHNPSFSIFDDGTRWKDHGTGEHGDAIDFLAQARDLSNADAIREFKRLAGLPESASTARSTGDSETSKSFSWSACVAALNEEHRAKLAAWRGYSPEFVAWLHAQNFIGLFSGDCIAFPVHGPEGGVVGCHYRLEDGSWRYHPRKTHVCPLVIGDPKTADSVLIFESQWDALAVMDKLGCHTPEGLPGTAIIITRGASNGKLVAGLCSPDALLYAFPQNDPARSDGNLTPAEKWLRDVVGQSGCKTLPVVTPLPHDDANVWTKTGAGADDLWQAIRSAKPFNLAPEHSVSISSSLDTEDNDEPPPTPFPTAALPPVLHDLMSAVVSAKGVPEPLPACCALATASAAIGSGLDVQSSHDQRTRANIFVVASAESGSGKSKVFKLVLAPLFRHEETVIERWKKDDGPRIAAEKTVLETEIHNAKPDIKKCQTQGDRERIIGEIKYRQAKLDELKAKAVPRLVAQDATIEALGTVLSQNHESLFSASADARKLADNLLGRYSQATNSKGKIADDSIYLQAFSGDSIIVDRQNRDTNFLREPCLALLWLVQPDIIERFLDEQSLQEGGFLARLLICHTQAAPQKIGETSVSVPEAVRLAWETLIADLLSTYHRPGAKFTVQPTTAASQRLIGHYNAIVDRLATDLHDVKPFAMRWTEQAWRLSVIFHAAQWGKDAHNHALALETAESAIAVADWFAAQQLDILARGRHEAARKLEDRVFDLLDDKHERQGIDYITKRDVLRARITRTAGEARALLSHMEQNGLLTGEDVRRAEGGHVRRIYRRPTGPNPVPG